MRAWLALEYIDRAAINAKSMAFRDALLSVFLIRDWHLTDAFPHIIELFFTDNYDIVISPENDIKQYEPYRSHADEDKAREELESFTANYPLMELPYFLAIIKADSDTLIGHIGAGGLDISETEQGCELEYAICKEYRGLRYATEALSAFAPWFLREFGEERIFALVHQENAASCKAVQNAGFRLYEGAIMNKKPGRNAYIYG